MDGRGVRVQQADMMLREIHHQTALRHSDLQRQFIFGLTVAAGVFLSSLRAEVPATALALAVPALAWSYAQAASIRELSRRSKAEAFDVIRSLDEPGEGLSGPGVNEP